MRPSSTIEVRNETTGTCVCRAARLADTSLSRFVGLLGKKTLPDESGLLIRPSSGVHTWGMSMCIDILALDAQDRVLGCYENVGPWKMRGVSMRTKSVLELPAGRIGRCGISVGDQVSIRPAQNDTISDL